jgi:endonuclease YncB( thermonuclease family)
MMKAIVFALLSLWLWSAQAESLEGRVVYVQDGDTFTMKANGHETKIRLGQIDAHELDQAFGPESKRSLQGLVRNRSVRVEVETIDKYGRTVGMVFADGVDVNREQIKRGMAWAYRHYLHDQSLLSEEDTAKQAHVGLWAEANPTPPWEHRASCGHKRYCKEMSSCREALHYLNDCGLLSLDRDKDGIPCETLCGLE